MFSLAVFAIAFLVVVGATTVCSVIASNQIQKWEQDEEMQLKAIQKHCKETKDQKQEGLS